MYWDFNLLLIELPFKNFQKKKAGESWLCPELSSPTHYIHNPKKDLVSDKGQNWANIHHCITWIPNQRLYGGNVLTWKVGLKSFLKEIYKCNLLFLTFCLIPHKLVQGRVGVKIGSISTKNSVIMNAETWKERYRINS